MVPIQINLDHYYEDFLSTTSGHIATMRAVLKTLENGTFQNRISPPSEETINLTLAVNLERIKEKIINDTFLALIRAFIEYEIKFLAVIRLKNEGTTIDTEIHSDEELKEYIQKQLNKIILEVSQDRNLDNPKKIDQLCSLLPEIKKVLLDYNDIRIALEHHMSVAKNEIAFTYRILRTTIDGISTVIKPGIILHEGQTIGIKIEDSVRIIPKGEKIIFTPEEIEGVSAWLQVFAIPQIVQTLISKTG